MTSNRDLIEEYPKPDILEEHVDPGDSPGEWF